jgi:hypothetical protein
VINPKRFAKIGVHQNQGEYPLALMVDRLLHPKLAMAHVSPTIACKNHRDPSTFFLLICSACINAFPGPNKVEKMDP